MSDEATDALRAALRIEANNPLALINLARMLNEMRDPRLLAEAETVSRRAVTLAPQLPLALATLARALRLQGRLDEAACLRRARVDARSRTAIRSSVDRIRRVGQARCRRRGHAGASNRFRTVPWLTDSTARASRT